MFLMLASLVARHKGEALQKFVDADIAQAGEALAATLETAGRGILYEHQPSSLAAARLMSELRAMIVEITKSAAAELGAGAVSGLERDAAIALRRMEEAAKATSEQDPQSTLFQQLLQRLLAAPPGTAASPEPTAPASSLIIP